jgi:hypothetical protein
MKSAITMQLPKAQMSFYHSNHQFATHGAIMSAHTQICAGLARDSTQQVECIHTHM